MNNRTGGNVWLERGDLVRLWNSYRQGIVRQAFERFRPDGEREVYKVVVAYGPREVHTIVGVAAVRQFVLVRESQYQSFTAARKDGER